MNEDGRTIDVESATLRPINVGSSSAAGPFLQEEPVTEPVAETVSLDRALRFLQMDPVNRAAAGVAGWIYIERLNWKAAKQCLSALPNPHPPFAAADYCRFRIAVHEKKFNLAREMLDAMVLDSTHDENLWFYLAFHSFARVLGVDEEVKAVKIPESASLRVKLAEIRYLGELGSPLKALEAARILLADHPNEPESYGALAYAASRAKKIPELGETINTGVERFPGSNLMLRIMLRAAYAAKGQERFLPELSIRLLGLAHDDRAALRGALGCSIYFRDLRSFLRLLVVSWRVHKGMLLLPNDHAFLADLALRYLPLAKSAFASP